VARPLSFARFACRLRSSGRPVLSVQFELFSVWTRISPLGRISGGDRPPLGQSGRPALPELLANLAREHGTEPVYSGPSPSFPSLKR
jgi:hypothetical protein